MTRTYITSTDLDEPREYFDLGKAQRWEGRREWDGQNRADVNVGANAGQNLLRTKGGRWVLHSWSAWVGASDSFAWATDEQAHDWLLFNGEEAAAERFFGPVAEERGPGRPEIGGRVCVRLGDDLAALDTWAATHGMSRADAVRYCVRHFVHAE